METKSDRISEIEWTPLIEQNSNWLSTVKSYYSDLTFFKQQVRSKDVSNPVEEQIRQDMLLNINTMMDKVQLEVIQDLLIQREYLENTNPSSIPKDKLCETSTSLNLKIEKIKTALILLKQRILDFLRQKQFGKRHGYPTFYSTEKNVSTR